MVRVCPFSMRVFLMVPVRCVRTDGINPASYTNIPNTSTLPLLGQHTTIHISFFEMITTQTINVRPQERPPFRNLFRRHPGLALARASLEAAESISRLAPVFGDQFASAIGVARSIIGIVEVGQSL